MCRAAATLDRLIASLRVRVAGTRDEVVGVDGDDESRRVPADRRQEAAGCRDAERRSERIVLLLRVRSSRAGSGSSSVAAGSSKATAGQVRVEDRLQLRGHLRQERSADRHPPAVATPSTTERFRSAIRSRGSAPS
jgi:hypothetical protein